MVNEMRIGILTFHNIPNIGALLQAYSLCTYIRSLGIENCYLIDYTCDNIRKRELMYHPKKNFLKNIVSKKMFWPRMERKIKECQTFMINAGLYSQKHYDRADDDLFKDYDAFISGSDMIWNLDVTDKDFTYFCDFLDDKKPRYSYASSVGGKWNESDYSVIKKYLSKYRRLSVREDDTNAIIHDILGLDCYTVPDPTMLLDEDEWIDMLDIPNEKNYVLVYFAYPEILSAAKKYAKEHSSTVLVIDNSILPFSYDVKKIPVYNPAQWLGLIYNAKAVFTDSYHGFLFALYFRKPVWTANYGNRFSSIIERLHLKGCFVSNDLLLKNTIDYDVVIRELYKIRQEGREYIEELICDMQSS